MNLSQADIDAMLPGKGGAVDSESSDSVLADYQETLGKGYGTLTAVEIDTLGEVGNICMGSVATTMYTLLDRPVEITTPRVSVLTTRDILSMYQTPLVVVEVEYTEGILGKNLLLLKEQDAAMITDVLMGGDGTVTEPIELSELHMSAINEIMNQMIGASATALSQVIGSPVNISTPESRHMKLATDASDVLATDDELIVITFDMEIEGLLKSQLVQMMPYEQGRAMSAMLVAQSEKAMAEATTVPAPAPAAAPVPAPAPAAPAPAPVAPAAAQPVQAPLAPYLPGGFDMVHDIPVRVSVELGKTKKEIGEILDFDMGTVVVLDKTAGDPVEILVNGKLVAQGEVVVIDENYGVRITALYR